MLANKRIEHTHPLDWRSAERGSRAAVERIAPNHRGGKQCRIDKTNCDPNRLCRLVKEITMSDKKVWFITGAGRGMGVDFAKAALADGYAVVATGRTIGRASCRERV